MLDPRRAVSRVACSKIWLAPLSEHLFMWKLRGLRKAASVGLGSSRVRSQAYIFLFGPASERMHHARPHASLSVHSIAVGPVPLFWVSTCLPVCVICALTVSCSVQTYRISEYSYSPFLLGPQLSLRRARKKDGRQVCREDCGAHGGGRAVGYASRFDSFSSASAPTSQECHVFRSRPRSKRGGKE